MGSPRPNKLPPPAKRMDRDELHRLREEEGLSGSEIARRIGFTAPSVRRALRELGIDLRPKRRTADEKWGERLYAIWRSLRSRCSKATHPVYARYGARGVTVAGEWDDFWSFYDWSITAGYRPGLNLDLARRARRFAPANCRWITRRERMARDGNPGGRESRWRITAFGESKSPSAWAKDRRCSVSPDVLRARIRRGVPPEEAVSLPSRSSLPRDGRRVRTPQSPRKLLDWARIIRLHQVEGLRPAEIAERVGAHESGIRRGLKERGAWCKPAGLDPLNKPLRRTWDAVRRRCEDPSDPSYRYYGARGIRLGAEWRDFHDFRRWAVESGYEPGLCLSLKKGRRVYVPQNCRWVTRVGATHNSTHLSSVMPARWTIDAFGERKGPTQWSRDERCEVSLSGLIRRLRNGWRPEDAISETPKTKGRTDAIVHPVTAFGTRKSLTAWERDRRCKVTQTTLRERLERGVRPEVAIATAPFGLSRSGGPRSGAPRP